LGAQAPDDPLRIIRAHVKLPGGEWRRVGLAGTSAAATPTDNAKGVRKLIQVFPDDVVPGDWIRDGGVFRSVSHMSPLVSSGVLLIHFEPVDGGRADLSVPVFQTVSVWRVCRDG
jgi:ABC-type cobalamin transport system ATPase subunit